MVTVHAKLLAKEHDLGGYTTYVFENLDDAPFGHKYLMLTRWPNWQCRNIDVGEVGYLEYDEVEAGVDTYYDRVNDSIVKYNFSNQIFKRFVKEQDNSNKDIII